MQLHSGHPAIYFFGSGWMSANLFICLCSCPTNWTSVLGHNNLWLCLGGAKVRKQRDYFIWPLWHKVENGVTWTLCWLWSFLWAWRKRWSSGCSGWWRRCWLQEVSMTRILLVGIFPCGFCNLAVNAGCPGSLSDYGQSQMAVWWGWKHLRCFVHGHKKEMNFFQMIFVIVHWLLVAKLLVQFAPHRQCKLKKW